MGKETLNKYYHYGFECSQLSCEVILFYRLCEIVMSLDNRFYFGKMTKYFFFPLFLTKRLVSVLSSRSKCYIHCGSTHTQTINVVF